MLRLDRIAIWIFIIAFALMIPSYTFLGYTDELAALLLVSLALADSLANGNWSRYTLLWICFAVMAFYAIYSVTAVDYNTPAAILGDSVIQIKSVAALAVMIGLRPRLEEKDCFILQWIALVNALTAIAISAMPAPVIRSAIVHPANCGVCVFFSTVVLFLARCRIEGVITTISKVIVVALLSGGLLCGRARYYGEYILALFMLLAFRPAMSRYFKVRYLLSYACVIGLIVAAGWSKISYYFLGGNITTFDSELLESFARPVLYATGALIMATHIPFGSGLASFASYKSSEPYSALYNEFSIDRIYGLSEEYPSFICDAYYPSLAQFGLVGVALFIALIIYMARRLVRLDKERFYPCFIVGMICLGFLLIESIANSSFVKPEGVLALSLIGIICGYASPAAKHVKKNLIIYV